MLLTNERHIAHLDLDCFFVAVEELRNPKLKGKPILVGGSGDRGVVASCSYEARKFGIHSAMPMWKARRLCSHAIVVKGDMEQYSKYSGLVTDIIRDSVPLFEKASIDEFYVDMTGMDKFFGCKKFTDELQRKVLKESGLVTSYGLASNKLVSKVATNEIKPNGQLEIPFGNEKSFLAPLSVVKIPGIGKERGYQLLKMGVETVKTLSEMPMAMLQNFFQKEGVKMWKSANGIDDTPVIPFHEQKSISTERTFDTDTIDMVFLKSTLVRMTEHIAFELRTQNKLTGCVAVKLRYSDGQTYNKQSSIPYTSADHILLKTAHELFDRLYERRQLVRLVGIRFTNLVPGNYQIRLFEDTEKKISMYQAIDSIKTQYGEGLLVRAGGIKNA